MPNTTLTIEGLLEDINTELGVSDIAVELNKMDIKVCLKSSLRLYNRNRPQRRFIALAVSSAQKKYEIDPHTGFAGVVRVSFLGPTAEYEGLFDPMTWDNRAGLPLAADTYGELMQRFQYLEEARRIVSSEPEWHGQWEDDGKFYLYISLATARDTVITSGIATNAQGRIAISDNGLTDGDYITIDDGYGHVDTFEFDNNSSIQLGNVRVTIGATLADTCVNLAGAINNNSTLYILAQETAVRVDLSHKFEGTQGNNATLAKTEANAKITLTQFSGGDSAGATQFLCCYEYLWHVTPDENAVTGLGWIPDSDTDWIFDYTMARAKMILARKIGKFGGVPTPEGGTEATDAEQLRSEAREDLTRLIDDIKKRRRPLPPAIG